MSIAGLDPSGGAGIAADLKTFFAHRCYGAAVVTSVTFQNTQGVFGAEHQSAESVRRQAAAVFEDLPVKAVKTGMLPTIEVIEAVAELLVEYPSEIVVDPVVRSTSGFDLIDDDALRALIITLFPLAGIVTPNLAEAERIVGREIVAEEDYRRAASEILEMGAGYVLIKGGHQKGDENKNKATDRLFGPDEMVVFEEDYIETTSTHGSGCTLSSAIAANLANGVSLEKSVKAAKSYVTKGIRNSEGYGKGNSPLNHWAGLKSSGER
ncbi:MAG: bifunctional hydroxymethylpyrimidine kinase/phosphomethylpyrimidine kinase [Pyrinomonadaceae bacterium]|nr:bifunctional hydroxymethylpyrimidine kinase/phosphomethylpyrimidine kinase [Pyrinomonadaceae bacterium]